MASGQHGESVGGRLVLCLRIFFFFQAEDGIRDLTVTGVQTCALPIFVETPDVTILLDPSVRLGPYRYDLPPHPTERSRQKELWQVIREASKKANVLTVDRKSVV